MSDDSKTFTSINPGDGTLADNAEANKAAILTDKQAKAKRKAAQAAAEAKAEADAAAAKAEAKAAAAKRKAEAKAAENPVEERAKTNAFGLLKADRKTITKYGQDHIENGKKILDLESKGANKVHSGNYEIDENNSLNDSDIDKHEKEIEYHKRKAKQDGYDARNSIVYNETDRGGKGQDKYRKNKLKEQKEKLNLLVTKINEKIEKTNEFKKKLRDKIRDTLKETSTGSDKGDFNVKDLENKLKRVNHHIKHLKKEKDKAENELIIQDYNEETTSERFRRICTSDTTKVFIFFCAISVFIFTITSFMAVTNKDYLEKEKAAKDVSDALIGMGITYFVVFSGLLSVSFGDKKDYAQKVASFFLLILSLFLGLYFTYLYYKGNIKNLKEGEEFASSIAVAVTFLYVSFAIYYDLFNKESSSLGEKLQIAYLFLSIGFFFAMGGIITYLTAAGGYKHQKNIQMMFPISAGLFGLGCFGILAMILSYFKSVDIAFSQFMNVSLKLFESTKMKIAILASFIMTIYYTYILYYSFSNDKVSGSNLPNDKINYRDNVIKNTFYAGVGIISLFLITLGVSFGGTLMEKLFSTLLVVFLIFVGVLFIYLDIEHKIKDLEKYEKDMLLASEIIFGILLFIAIWYVLFKSKVKGAESLSALGRIITNIGSLVFFVYSFALISAITWWYWPGGFTKTPGEIWAGWGVGILLIIFIIYTLI